MTKKIYKENFVLHDAATTTGIGEAMYVGNGSMACIQISGTSTSFELEFEASLDNITFERYYGSYKLDGKYDISYVNNLMVDFNNLYYFNVRPVKYIRVKITSITNGNISIIGYDSV